MRLLAALFAEGVAATDVNRDIALKVGQREIHPPVAAIGGAEEREQRLVLIDRQELPVAQRPALGGEAKGHDADFGEKWFRHEQSPVTEGSTLFPPSQKRQYNLWVLRP